MTHCSEGQDCMYKVMNAEQKKKYFLKCSAIFTFLIIVPDPWWSNHSPIFGSW